MDSKMKMTQSKLKRIQFDQLSSWPFQLILGLGAVCFIIGFIIGGWDYNFLMIIGQLIITLFLCRSFFFKRYVGWNNKGMQLKFGWFDMKAIPFDTIQRVSIEDELLLIKRLDDQEYQFDISGIASEDVLRLEGLISRLAKLSQPNFRA